MEEEVSYIIKKSHYEKFFQAILIVEYIDACDLNPQQKEFFTNLKNSASEVLKTLTLPETEEDTVLVWNEFLKKMGVPKCS